jgi:hypothetical protein
LGSIRKSQQYVIRKSLDHGVKNGSTNRIPNSPSSITSQFDSLAVLIATSSFQRRSSILHMHKPFNSMRRKEQQHCAGTMSNSRSADSSFEPKCDTNGMNGRQLGGISEEYAESVSGEERRPETTPPTRNMIVTQKYRTIDLCNIVENTPAVLV